MDSDRARSRRLIWPNLLLVVAFALHDLDHLRQGRDIEAPVVAIGILGDVVALTSLALAVTGHRIAPLAAVVVGFGTVLGFIAVHVVPDWGPLSQGYPDLPVDGVSWLAVIVPMAAGSLLAVRGLALLRGRAVTTTAA
jgi:hypothetical protein